MLLYKSIILNISTELIDRSIFEVFKNRVGIFTEPQPLEQILWKDGRWTPEEFSRVMPETLTRGKEREKYPKTLPYVFDI